MIVQNSGGKKTVIRIEMEKNNLVIDIEDAVTVNSNDKTIANYLENMYVHADQINGMLQTQMDTNLTVITLTVPL